MNVGDRVSWRSYNRDETGTVLRSDERGALVAVDNGGTVLLTTKESYEAMQAARNKHLKIKTI